MNNVSNQEISQSTNKSVHHLDATGLICPEPIMLLHQKIRRAEPGDVIKIIATDPATLRDIPNFCNHLGHTLINESRKNDDQADEETIYYYTIRKK